MVRSKPVICSQCKGTQWDIRCHADSLQNIGTCLKCSHRQSLTEQREGVINLPDFVYYCETSSTKLRWNNNVIHKGKAGVTVERKSKGREAGSLKLGNIIYHGVKYRIVDLVLKLQEVEVPEGYAVHFIDNNRKNFSIHNLTVRKLQRVSKKEKGTVYSDRVILNKTNKRERRMCHSAKERARKTGVVFNISFKDIHIPEKCPILGIPLYQGLGKVCPNSPSLDRKVPSLGYIPENVWVISHLANTMKSSGDEAILLSFAEWVFNEYRPI